MTARISKHPNIKPAEKIFGGIWSIKCLDYVDTTNSIVLDGYISNLLEERKPNILVDFTELNFITSDVPNILLAHLGKAREMGGDILVLNPMQSVMDIIELLGLTEVLNIAPDQGSALNYFHHLATRGFEDGQER